MNPQDVLQKMQSIANEMQSKVSDAIKQTPAKDLEKNVRSLMTQGFQKMDLVTREEFDIQTQVLAKTRAKLEELEAKVAALEKNSKNRTTSWWVFYMVGHCFLLFKPEL